MGEKNNCPFSVPSRTAKQMSTVPLTGHGQWPCPRPNSLKTAQSSEADCVWEKMGDDILIKECWYKATFKSFLPSCNFYGYNTQCVQFLRFVQLLATLWTIAHQAPLSTGFPRQENWSGLPFPPQGIFQTQGSNSCHPHPLYYRPILYCWATREAQMWW